MVQTYVRLGTVLSRAPNIRARREARPRANAARQTRLRRLAQPLRFGQLLQLLERAILDLADALARDVEGAADLLERERAPAGDAVAQFDHLALAAGQGGEHARDVLAPQRFRGALERRLRGDVLDELRERRAVVLAHRFLQRHGLLSDAQDVAHLARRAFELCRELVLVGLAAQLLDEAALDVDEPVQALDHVHR